MATNLLAYGFPNESNQPNVADELDKIKNYLSHFKTSETGFESLINELEKTLEAVQRRERMFYNKLKVKDFQELNQKIKNIEQEYNILLPNGEIVQYVKQHYSFVGIEHASDAELQDATEATLNEFLANEMDMPLTLAAFEKVNGKKSSSIVDALSVFLQQRLSSKSGKRFITVRKSKGTDKVQNVGLGRIITAYDPKKKKVIIDLQGELKISSTFRKKLERDLTNLYEQYNDEAKNKIKPESKEIYRQQLNDIIQSRLGSFATLGINTNQFDLNRSISSTIGYLGEIRAAIILNKLVPDGGKLAQGTGTLRTFGKGQQIPIDIVCLANGFQVKNYSLDNNCFVFSGGQQVPYWITNRLQLTGTISEVLINLFSIYQYNQPLSHGTHESLEAYIDYYSKIDNELLYDLKEVFDSRIPQVMKISDYFSVEGSPIFNSPKLYFNTFFWINEYLVPSSWIIQQLISSLKQKNTNKIIKTKYDFVKKSQGSKYRWQVLGQKHKKDGSPYTPYFMASQVRANYDITIDLSIFENMKFSQGNGVKRH